MLITIPFHESAHALASHLLGDDTAVRAGRFSMNPLRHFDPLGALCMLVGGVGWAKPVSINPVSYTHLDVYKRQMYRRPLTMTRRSYSRS